MTGQPNSTDPVEDDAYPGVTANTGADALAAPPEGWDTDPALAGPQRASAPVAEPDEAWEQLRQMPGWAG